MQRRPLHRSPWHRWLAGLAVLALVGTQWLGLAHAVLHAPHGGALQLAASQAAHDPAFGHEKGSPLCQLFDLAAQADGVAPSVAVLPLSAPANLPPADAPRQGCAQAATALYLARAPPHQG
jgi:hypothetical protein